MGIVMLQGSPEETTEGFMKPGIPNLKEISKIKMKFEEWYVKNRN